MQGRKSETAVLRSMNAVYRTTSGVQVQYALLESRFPLPPSKLLYHINIVCRRIYRFHKKKLSRSVLTREKLM
jgi:hypothetical protein